MTDEQNLKPILEYYMNIPIEAILNEDLKEKYKIILKMNISISSNGKEAPYFTVQSEDGTIDADFSIEDSELLRGEIDANTFKRIKAFYSDPKTQKILKKIWRQKGH